MIADISQADGRQFLKNILKVSYQLHNFDMVVKKQSNDSFAF